MRAFSARGFNQDVSAAKRAAMDAPVMITDRGRASHVLMTMQRYAELVGETEGWADRLRMDEDVDFEPARLDFEPRVPNL